MTKILGDELARQKGKASPREAITRTMAKTDDQLKLVGASDTGSTCCLALIRKEGGGRRCYVANVGDSRAVLSFEGAAKRVSVDHKPTTQSEIERIKYATAHAGRKEASSSREECRGNSQLLGHSVISNSKKTGSPMSPTSKTSK